MIRKGTPLLLVACAATAACTTVENQTISHAYKESYAQPKSCAGQKSCITTVAGTGVQAYGDDNVVGWKSDLNFPQDAVVGPGGVIYYIDWNDHRIRKLDATSGITTTVVGSGKIGDVGKGEIPTDAALNHPTGITFDKAGVLWIAAWHNSKIKKVDPAKNILEEFAGTGGRAFGGDGGPAAKAVFDLPSALDFDDAGDMYIADQSNQRIRKVDMKAGTISTVVGSRWVTDTLEKAGKPLLLPANAQWPQNADGTPAPGAKTLPAVTYGTFQCKNGGIGPGHVDALAPWGVDLPTPSTNSVCQFDLTQPDFCKKATDGTPAKLNLPAPDLCGGFGGDGGPALAAYLAGPKLQFSYPASRLVIRKNKMFIADTYNNRIRMVDLSAAPPTIDTVAGDGTAGYAGDGGDAKAAQLNGPTDVDQLPDGTLLIADKDNHCIRAVRDGKISTFAGQCGKQGFAGDGGAAEQAKFNQPFGIGVGPDGTVYVADTWNQRLRAITPK